MTNVNNLHWAVAVECQASKFEEPFDRIIAVFQNPVNAEEFIKMALPKETRDRFCIKRI